MQRGQGQRCCVPSCDPQSSTGRYFRPPVQKPQLCQSWKDLLSTSANIENFDPAVDWVCSKHFQDQFILKEDVVFENGIRISIPLTNWRLKDDAIPTIFEQPKPKPKETITTPTLDTEESSKSKSKTKTDDSDSPSVGNRVTVSEKIFEDKEVQEPSEVQADSSTLRKNVNKVVKKKSKSKKGGKRKKINRRSVVVGPGRKQVLISRVDLGDRIDNVRTTNSVPEPPASSTPPPSALDSTSAARPGRPRKAIKIVIKKVLGSKGRGRPPGSTKSKQIELGTGDVDDIWKPSSGLDMDSSIALSKGRAKRSVRSASWRPSGDTQDLDSNEDDAIDTFAVEIPKVKVTKLKVKEPTIHQPECFMDACKDSGSSNLYKCPLSDRKIITQWMKSIPQSKNGVFDVSKDLLCDKHFESKYFVNISTGTVLSKDAVPTKFEEKSLKRTLFVDAPTSSPKMPKLQVEVDPLLIDTPSPVSRVLGLRCYSRKGDQTEVIEREPTEISSNKKKVTVVKGIKSKAMAMTKTSITPSTLENGLLLGEDIPLIPRLPPKPQEVFLKMGQAGYDLNYIFNVKEKFERPIANKWIFELMTDTFTKQQSIYIAELVSRNDELTFQRVIKIFHDLTFKVETNGIDVTSMFNELGTQIDTLTKLQEIMNDLAAFQVCQGWSGFKMVVDCEVGKKVGGIWYSKNCESLKLDRIRCQRCSSIANTLKVRKARILKILQKAEASIQDQIRLLPPDDPLRLQIQIQELIEERNKLKKELQTKNVREVRLQKNFKVLTNNLHQGKSVKVRSALPTPALKTYHVSGPASQKQKIANNYSTGSTGVKVPTSILVTVPGPRKKPGPLSRTAVSYRPTASTSQSNNISAVRPASSTTTVQNNPIVSTAVYNNSINVTAVRSSSNTVQGNPTVSTVSSNNANILSTSSSTVEECETISTLVPVHTFDHSDTLLINNMFEMLPNTPITFALEQPSTISTTSGHSGTYFLLQGGDIATLSPQQITTAAMVMTTPTRPLFVSHSVDECAEDGPLTEPDIITLL